MKHKTIRPYLFLFISLIVLLLTCVGIVSAVGTYPAVDPNMILYYHFNNDSSVGESYIEGTNYTIYDYSNSKRNVTTNTKTFSSSGSILSDGYFTFNGTSKMSVDNNVVSNTTNFSISGWVKGSNTLTNEYIYGEGNSTNTIPLFGIYPNLGKLHIIYRNNSNVQEFSVDSNGNFFDNTWHYFVVNYNLTTYSIYLDGVLDKNGTYNHTLISPDLVTVGALCRTTCNSYYTGSLDELIIYNRTLSEVEIKTNYNNYANICQNTPSYLCSVKESVTFDGKVYNGWNGTARGAINISANNVILDCNGSTFNGNSSTASNNYGFYSNGFNNITIKNCNFSNYLYDYYFRNQSNTILRDSFGGISTFNVYFNIGGNNISLINNTLINAGSVSIDHDSGTILNNLTAINNTFLNYYNSAFEIKNFNGLYLSNNSLTSKFGYSLYNGINANINNNYFTNCSSTYRIYFNNVSGNISDNQIIQDKCSGANINIVNSSNVNIFRNNIYNITKNGFTIVVISTLGTYTYNISIYQNNLTYFDGGLKLRQIRGLDIYSNIFNYSTNNQDWYDSPIFIETNSSNIRIYNNSMYNTGNAGIALRYVSNVNVTNNYIDMISDELALTVPQLGAGEPECAIFINEIYGQWTEITFAPLNLSNNLTNMMQYARSYNINISGNTFGSNTQCYLRNQGGFNVSYSLPLFWYKKIQFPNYLVDPDEFFNNPLFENLTTKASSILITDRLRKGYMNTYMTSYKIHKNWLYFINEYNINLSLSLFNLSSPLISFSNGTGIYQSGTNLEFNLSLSPNNYTYVLEDFNCSESLQSLNGFPCGRENSPINIISTSNIVSGKTWNIASNITNDLSNILFQGSVDCSRIGTVKVIPKDKSEYRPSYTCLNNILIIYNTNFSYSTNSNQVQALYDIQLQDTCNNFFSSGNAFVDFVIILIIMGILVSVIFLLGMGEGIEMDLTGMAGIIIVALVVMSLGMIIIKNIGSC